MTPTRPVRAQMDAYSDSLHAYVARPDDDRSYPGVILVQEWWGIEPHIKSLTERLAAEGFVVLAPDLYHGKVATAPDEAQRAMMALDMDRAVTEIMKAAVYLKGRDDVSPKRLGMTGFCMGGLLTWKTAEREGSELAAIAPFYGGGYEPTAEDIRRIKAPVLAVWGQHDEWISAQAREHVIQLLENEHRPHEVLVCDAKHAFMNDRRPNFDPACAQEAWGRLLEFFHRHLA